MTDTQVSMDVLPLKKNPLTPPPGYCTSPVIRDARKTSSGILKLNWLNPSRDGLIGWLSGEDYMKDVLLSRFIDTMLWHAG